ncbi:MAG: AIR carboxylase family protein, partial [Gemmatimonadaceae bacterium]
MRRDRVKALLAEVASGQRTVDEALSQLDGAPVEDLGFATVDTHRALRQGYPEVVFGQGKTPAQVVAIAERLATSGDGFLVTRAEPAVQSALAARFPTAEMNALGRTVLLRATQARAKGQHLVAVVTAGTSDLPVAEECAVTLDAMGHPVQRITDVGVAGIHRILARRETLADAAVVIVVAGMDGALPSV